MIRLSLGLSVALWLIGTSILHQGCGSSSRTIATLDTCRPLQRIVQDSFSMLYSDFYTIDSIWQEQSCLGIIYTYQGKAAAPLEVYRSDTPSEGYPMRVSVKGVLRLSSATGRSHTLTTYLDLSSLATDAPIQIYFLDDELSILLDF